MNHHSRLPDEISAEIQLSIPALAKRAGSLQRQHLKSSRMLRNTLCVFDRNDDSSEEDSVVSGVSSKSKSIPFRSSRLFGVSAVCQPVEILGEKIVARKENARFTIGLAGGAEWKRRAQWKRIAMSFEILRETIDDEALILLDTPLIVSHRLETGFQSTDLRRGWDELVDAYNDFWTLLKDSCYPFKRKGPLVLSVQPRLSPGLLGVFLKSIEEQLGQEIGPIEIQNPTSVSYVIDALMNTTSHTYPVEVENLNSIYEEGEISVEQPRFSVFYFRNTPSTKVLQIIVPGDSSNWFCDLVHKTCRQISSLVHSSSTDGLPFPLSLAKRKSDFTNKTLKYAARRILKQMVR